jgi:hypothetical protein
MAKLEGGNTAKCKVTVAPLYATKISTSKKLSLYVGNTDFLPIKVVEGGKEINTIEWTSSNSNIATVNNYGKITGKKAGSCNISGKLLNGNTVTCLVTVKSRPVLVITDAKFYIGYYGAIETDISFENNFGKTIKYIYFNTYFYNSVGDPAYCDIYDTNYARLQKIGPIKSGTNSYGIWDAVIYNDTTGEMYLKSADIIFMDGTTKTISIKKSYKK